LGWGNVRRLGMKLEGTAVQKGDSVVLPPPPGVAGGTESNIRQLWSLTFLAVQRNSQFR